MSARVTGSTSRSTWNSRGEPALVAATSGRGSFARAAVRNDPPARLRRGEGRVSLTEVIELTAGDMRVNVLPERGLDIGRAWFRGEPVAWESPLGELPWQGDFARSFGGGLLVTCGLRNVGLPSEGQPQHGWYSSLPARDVEVDAAAARARVVEADVPGET